MHVVNRPASSASVAASGGGDRKERDLLHMIVNTHNPQDCVFRGDAESEAMRGALRRFHSVAREHGVEPQGTWMSRAAHEIFLLVEAPNVHAIEEILVDAGLVGLTRSQVLPVLPSADVIGVS